MEADKEILGMRKTVTLLIGAASVAALLAITACKQFLADIEEDFSYWAAEPVITGFKIDPSVKTQQNNNRVLCVPSAGPVTVTMKVHNPKNFSFIMPDSAGAPTDIVSFGDGKVKGSGGAKPAYGTDYTLAPTSDGKALELTYTSAFLKANEWSDANIGASIKLYSTDGRKFNQTYKFDLEANTPPQLEYVTIGKTADADAQGKYYYVIILKAEDMTETAGTASELLHKDIKTLSVTGGDSADIAFTPGNTGFFVDTGVPVADRRLLAANEVVPLASDEGPTPPSDWSTLNSDPWALRYKTNIVVKAASKTYTFRLTDKKGLSSSPVSPSTSKTKAQDAQLFNGTTEISGTGELSPYSMNAELSAASVSVTAQTATVGAKITGRLEKPNDSSWVPRTIDSGSWSSIDIPLTAPAADQEALYKITVAAGGDGFVPGTEKVFYVKVTKNTTITINPNDNSTWKGESNAWDALKTAVQTASDGAVITVGGDITYSNTGAKSTIEVTKNITVKSDGTKRTLNAGGTGADGSSANSKVEAVFEVNGSGITLTLEDLTLTKTEKYAVYVYNGASLVMNKVTIEDCKTSFNAAGICFHGGKDLSITDSVIKKCKGKGSSSSGGIDIQAPQAGGTLSITSTTFENCKAVGNGTDKGNGGGINIYKGSLTLSGCTFTGCEAKDGGAIFASGATVTITNCTLAGNTAQKNGGAIYVKKTDDGIASTVIIKGGTIGGTDGNKVTDTWGFGGGIYVNDDCILTLNEYTDGYGVKHGVRIIGNEAGRAGGVRANNSTVTMENCTISGNKATDSSNLGGGGGVYTHGGTLTMTRCTLTGNTAVNNGGGLNIEKGSAVITNCTLTGNTAKENGGAIYVKEIDGTASTVTIEGGTVGGTGTDDANKATGTGSNGNGGGIYIGDSCTLTLENNGSTACTLTGNEAAKAGGGVYVDGTMTMSGRATVTPSVGSDIDKPGKNDVYLKSGKTITVNGKLNPTGGTAARITPETYSETPQVQVLTGAIKDYNNYTKFTVTPQTSPSQNWKVDSNGKLKKQ